MPCLHILRVLSALFILPRPRGRVERVCPDASRHPAPPHWTRRRCHACLDGWHSTATGHRGPGRALAPLPAVRAGGGRGHGPFPAAVRAIVAGGGVPAGRPPGVARRFQAAYRGGVAAVANPKRAGGRGGRGPGQGSDLRAQPHGQPTTAPGRSLDRACSGPRGRFDAGAGGGTVRAAQELGLSAAGVMGTPGRRGQGGATPGPAGAEFGAAVDPVARGQPSGGPGRGTPRGADGPGDTRRHRPVAWCRRGTGAVYSGPAT